MLMFMEKPSKKLYPDYYKVIDNPIDMLTIEANIKAEKYQSEDEVLSDFKVKTLSRLDFVVAVHKILYDYEICLVSLQSVTELTFREIFESYS